MNSEELKCTIHNPFGPMILSVNMTKHHTDELIKLSENNRNRKNMDSRLAGQIESEPMLSHEELNLSGFTEIFCNIGKSYVMQRSTVYNEKLHNINVSLQAAWIVSQKQNEYNPVHAHTHCQLSAVMYLIIPEFKPRGYKGKENIDGIIEFINSSVDGSQLQAGQFRVKPKPGMLLMFPSNLLHTVYPFQGSQERRCVAFNLNFNLEKINSR